MKILVTIFVIFNSFVWFIASAGSLSNLSRGIVPAPTKPSIALVVFLFILFLTNLVTLFYVLRKTNDAPQPGSGINMRNIFIGLGWFVIIYFAASFMIGMVIGATAGSATTTPAAGAEAGRLASIDFFHKYGVFIFLGSVLVAIGGTVTGWLPFTKDED